MNKQLKTTFTGILLAITVAATSAVVEAGKGSGKGGGSGSGNGATHGSGPSTGYGYGTRNSNQYKYQHQHQYQYRNGNGDHAAGSGSGQFNDDKYLNQQDFQAWLEQNQSKARTQNHNQVQNMAQDGLWVIIIIDDSFAPVTATHPCRRFLFQIKKIILNFSEGGHVYVFTNLQLSRWNLIRDNFIFIAAEATQPIIAAVITTAPPLGNGGTAPPSLSSF